jgi:hypothetical protein
MIGLVEDRANERGNRLLGRSGTGFLKGAVVAMQEV